MLTDLNSHPGRSPATAGTPHGIRFRIDHPELVRFCETNRQSILPHLPFMAREVVRCTSLPTLLKLVATYGGGKCFVPQKVSETSSLALAVGMDNACRLAERFEGGSFHISSAAAVWKAIQPALFAKLRSRGVSVAKIARTYGCSCRTVERVLARQRDETETRKHG